MKKGQAFLIITLFVLAACREEYQPQVTQQNLNYLVVEGIINPDSTTVMLSRTRTINDTTTLIPEPNAVVFIQGERGSSYLMTTRPGGIYTIGTLPLDLTDKYRLKISVSSKQYVSDFVNLEHTPPIDSVSWNQNTDVTISLSTHDPTNNTRYYRWEYEETWEFHSYYDSHLGYSNGQIYFLDSSQIVHVCYNSAASTQILLGTSAELSNDIIDNTPITVIPDGSEKLTERYSILVKQYALTKEAYEFWQLLRRNTNQVGGLFDAQPSELIGNLHCISNPAEPVIGYVSASTVETKRIFIGRTELSFWHYTAEDFFCTPKIISDSVQYYLSDTSMAPAYFVTGGALAIAKKSCVDCRRHGGKTVKPPFWP
jgi:hypothetical protein